jgi:hypothetical protein
MRRCTRFTWYALVENLPAITCDVFRYTCNQESEFVFICEHGQGTRAYVGASK